MGADHLPIRRDRTNCDVTHEWKEFTAEDLTALGSMGIWPNPAYILARFLESIRSNLDTESIRAMYRNNDDVSDGP